MHFAGSHVRTMPALTSFGRRRRAVYFVVLQGEVRMPALRPKVRIVRCTVRLPDLLLVIRSRDKHSCGVTIPDRLIGVDDVDSPGQRR